MAEDITPAEDAGNETSVLDVSDEEFLNMSFEDVEDENPDTSNDEENTEEEDDDDEDNTTDDSAEDETEGEETEDEDEEDDEENIAEGESEESEEDDSEDNEESDEEENDEDSEEKDDGDDSEVDKEQQYDTLMQPFKANGAEMQIKNVDDAITLMKMGANYHKKMAGLKPSLKIVKLLEKNGLLDVNKINFLIDLNANDPKAITKLINDSGVDPAELDSEDVTDYKPSERTVTDTELELDNVLESIKKTPTYSKTLNVITEQWDDSSRGLIASTPQIIEIINEHMADGTYDTIAAVVNRERTLGRLQGKSDLEAYKAVGDILSNNHQLPGQVAPKVTPSQKTKKKTTSANEKSRKKQKQGVSPTKSTKTTRTLKADYNPLALSDEEFAKLSDIEF